MKTVYTNASIPTSRFRHLFVVDDAPPEMVANVGRHCYLRIQTGMINPHGVEVDGVEVAPLWSKDPSEPTEFPREYVVRGIQYDYAQRLSYRIHAVEDDKFGRCASVEDVIWIPGKPEAAPEWVKVSNTCWLYRTGSTVLATATKPSENTNRWHGGVGAFGSEGYTPSTGLGSLAETKSCLEDQVAATKTTP